MKKTYLIIGGITAIVLLLAIWVYLLIYGTPKPVENFFTDFSFSGSDVSPIDTPFIPVDSNGVVDVDSNVRLRQLTIRPVIGFSEYKPDNSSNEQFVLYAEAGTGHIYSINLLTGTETRLSNITIPNAHSATFSFNGQLAAVRSGYGAQNAIELITLGGENSATKETLTPKMVDFTFNDSEELLYTEYNSVGLLARSLNTETDTSRSLFLVPFQNATIIWNTDNLSDNFVYPKPTAKLPGFLYRIANGTLLREPISGNGLGVEVNNQYLTYTITTANGPISYVQDRASKQVQSLPVGMQPSKCVFSREKENILYCGYSSNNLTGEFPDNWYKGLISLSDKLFEIDIKKGLAAQLSDPQSEMGREIDMIDMSMSRFDTVLYFVNKNDNTLWMYEI